MTTERRDEERTKCPPRFNGKGYPSAGKPARDGSLLRPGVLSGSKGVRSVLLADASRLERELFRACEALRQSVSGPLKRATRYEKRRPFAIDAATIDFGLVTFDAFRVVFEVRPMGNPLGRAALSALKARRWRVITIDEVIFDGGTKAVVGAIVAQLAAERSPKAERDLMRAAFPSRPSISKAFTPQFARETR